MGFEKYEVGTPVEEFEKALKNLAVGSQEIYRSYFNEFIEFNGSTPEKFYEWCRSLEADTDPRSRKQLSNAYADFRTHKIEQGYNEGTARNYVKAIHKFLEANGLLIRIKTNGKKIQHKGQDIVSREQVKLLLDLSGRNLRLRALLTTLKDSGLGVGEIPKLTIEDFLGARETRDEKGRRFRQWADPIAREKTGELCHVCLGPEAIHSIDNYIGGRKTGTIFITSKGQPHKDEEGNITAEAGFTEKGSPLKSRAVSSTIRHLCAVLKNKGYKVSAHSFRKLFETSFEIEGKLNTAKYIMGKTIPASDEPYLKLGDNLLKSYMEVYTKHLLLDDSGRELEELKKVQEARDMEVENLRKQVADLTNRMNQIGTYTQQATTANKELETQLIERAQTDPEGLIKELREGKPKKHQINP